MNSDSHLSEIGAVVIGRNEGKRLEECLDSLVRDVTAIVYVDSGSSDGSAEMSEARGFEVVRLEVGVPFTAARARNAGLERLHARWPACNYVFFVDGDCRVQPGWIAAARRALAADVQVAVVCGRRRERFPGHSIYNLLCDLEWDTPVGEAKSCGGDAMMRISDFLAVGGFDPAMIAGEEPELCVRLRLAGKRIVRIAEEMTLHDAAISRFSQWWLRTKRAGHAYAEGTALHGRSSARHGVRELRSVLFWALALPCVIAGSMLLAIGWFTTAWALAFALIALYPLLWVRVWRGRITRGTGARVAALYATFTVLGKFPQCLGVLSYGWHRYRGRRRTLFEYKEMTQ